MFCVFFFFFKQKTAYEMRISDWSSDVCSSDLDERRAVSVDLVALEIDLDAAPASTADVYLRLHALSHRLVAPNDLNLDGIFAHLPTVAWTTAGPMHPDDATRLRPLLLREGVQVQGLAKFPRLLDYAPPRSEEHTSD